MPGMAAPIATHGALQPAPKGTGAALAAYDPRRNANLRAWLDGTVFGQGWEVARAACDAPTVAASW